MKTKQKQISLGVSLFLGFLVLATAAFVYRIQTKEVEAYGGQPFGGTVESMIECTCSEGYQLGISGPAQSSGTYLYTSGVQTYSHNSVHSGGNLLGEYSGGGTCLIEGDPCTELPITKGTITRIGTSY